MKLVSFNIRCDHGQDGINNFCHRQDLIVRVIQREKPDLIGFQEMLPHMRSRLEESLGQAYLFVGCGRGKDLGDESMSVALRRDRLELVNLDVFWLSETPGVPGSRFKEQSDCPRLCTHVLVHALDDGRLLHVYNTHLDHISSRARQLGLAMVLEMIRRDQREWPHPIVLMGDFNATPDSQELGLMRQMPEMQDFTAEIPWSFHAFGGLEEKGEGQKIDYIFASGLVCQGARRWMDKEAGVYLSDHYPVEVCCRLEDEGSVK